MPNVPELIARPHNNFFVSQMRDPAHAAGMVRPLLDERLAAVVGWEDMALEPGSYIDEKLRGSESDLLFSVPVAGKSSLLYVLIEHQSTPDAHMPLRLLGYMAAIWRTYAATHPGKRLPAILPVVLAQCEQPWPHEATMRSLLDIPEGLGELIEPMQPLFAHKLLDLAKLLPEEIQGTEVGAAVLRVMRAARTGNLDGLLEAALDMVAAAARGGDARMRIMATITYILATAPVPAKEVIERMQKLRMPEELIQDTMSAAELLFKEGRQEGRQEEAQDAVIQALETRFDRVPDGLREEIRHITDALRLKDLHRAAIRSADIESFAKEL